jgi:hypothetical protein
MILVNLNEEKVLRYDISDINRIKKATLIILLPNNVELRYDGIIKKFGVEIKVPVLKNIVVEEIEVPCFLEIEDKEGVFYPLAKDTMYLQFSKIIKLKFHSEQRPPIVKKSKPLKDESFLIKNEIEPKYQTKEKPKRRSEVISADDLT